MTERGSVRVGTLQEYRGMEAGGNVRGDAGEGTRIITSAREPTRYEDGSAVHRWLASNSICVKGGIYTNGENAMNLVQRHPDCFVYCVSETFSPDLMEKFGGACIVITNPILFFCSLNAHLCDRIRSIEHPPSSIALSAAVCMTTGGSRSIISLRSTPALSNPSDSETKRKCARYGWFLAK